MGETQFSGFIAPNLESEKSQVFACCCVAFWQQVLSVKSGRALLALS